MHLPGSCHRMCMCCGPGSRSFCSSQWHKTTHRRHDCVMVAFAAHPALCSNLASSLFSGHVLQLASKSCVMTVLATGLVTSTEHVVCRPKISSHPLVTLAHQNTGWHKWCALSVVT
jgi:hypothetical protein